MKRRDFLVCGSAALAAGGTAVARPAVAQGRTEWRMVTTWPKNAPGVGVNAQRLADRITAMSDGRLTVKLFAAGELVPPFESFDAVQRGTADCLHGTPYYWQGKSPAFHYFTDLPFGLTAWERIAWMYFGGGQALWEEAYAPFGLKPFYAGSSGVQAGGWFRREINTLDDLRGLKMRIAGLGGEVMRRLGVTVTLTPPGEIFAAMQSGVVDAAEWVGPWNDLAFGLQKTARYYYLPAFHEGGPALEFTVSRAKLEALPKDLQAIVAAACSAQAHETLADFTHNNLEAFQRIGDLGIELKRWPDDVVAALGRESKAVLAELAGRGGIAAKVAAAYDAYVLKAASYSAWTDQAFLEMRRKAVG